MACGISAVCDVMMIAPELSLTGVLPPLYYLGFLVFERPYVIFDVFVFNLPCVIFDYYLIALVLSYLFCVDRPSVILIELFSTALVLC